MNHSGGGFASTKNLGKVSIAKIEFIRFIIENDVEYTPLHIAVINGHHKIAHLLLMQGFNPNAEVPGVGTPLNALLTQVTVF